MASKQRGSATTEPPLMSCVKWSFVVTHGHPRSASLCVKSLKSLANSAKVRFT